MAKNVFISFRFSDGHKYKEELATLFTQSDDTVDYSENEDRSQMSDQTIQNYLYKKLRRSSVTIILLTPDALEYRVGMWFNPVTRYWEERYDDWLYDEVRYSLEDRVYNAPNGLVAVYTPDVADRLVRTETHYCEVCRKASASTLVTPFNNLFYKNMMNVKPEYKKQRCLGVYDRDWDSYCSLISYDEFKTNFSDYIDIAYQKRDDLYKYNLCKRIHP